jgi:hypothetical protein
MKYVHKPEPFMVLAFTLLWQHYYFEAYMDEVARLKKRGGR